VMQRLALCYVMASIIMIWYGTRGRIATVASCLIGYWVLMRFVPVPGYGVPTCDVPLLDPAGNLSGWLDRTLYRNHTHGYPFDPEGLLSTIPALGHDFDWSSDRGVATFQRGSDTQGGLDDRRRFYWSGYG
jgi:predicted acyltransferase